MLPDAIDAFFKSREKIETCFSSLNIAVDDTGRFAEWFQPDPERTYYIHVDLAQKHDHCAVSMSHVEKWTTMKIAGQMKEAAPVVVVDAVRWWTPTSDKSVDFTEVRDYILSLKYRGFNIRLVTFDRWNSHDMMESLKAYGMNAEILSVAKKHYDDMALVVMEERLHGPRIQLLIDELLQLRINKDKVDHPRKGSKDLADAVCGSVYNAVSKTPRDLNQTIEIYNYDREDEDLERKALEERGANIIRLPESPEMPDIIKNFLEAGVDGDEGFVDRFSML